MATYKCRSCGHEVILEARPSGCECCGGRDFFIDYAAYESLIFEISRLETEVSKLTRLETEKLSLEKKVAELQLKIQRRTKNTNPKVIIVLFASILKLTRLETEKLSLEKKVAELQLKIQRRTKNTNPKATIVFFASVLMIISAVVGIFWYNQYLSSLLQYLR